MALNSSTLAALIKANLLAAPTGAQDNAALQATCTAIASAVVAHIQSSAGVAGVVVVPPGGGSIPFTGTVS